MREYELSITALQQLDDIYDYTLRRWSEDQARDYISGFYELFDEITAGKSIDRLIPKTMEIDGYMTTYKKHFVYWQVFDDNVVGIFAILHQQQSQIDRLKEAYKTPFG